MASILYRTTTSPLHMFVLGNTMDFSNSSPLTCDFNCTTLQPAGSDGDFFDPFNNPANLISSSTRKTAIRLLDYVYILFVIVGVPGNIINCLVFYRQGLRDRMNLCLCWLAVSDMLYLLSVSTTRTIVTFIELVDPEFSEKYDTYSRLYLSGQIFSFLTTSSWTTVVIAIERCVCVLFPLKAQTLMSTRTMAILLLTITLLLQLGFSLFLFMWRVKEIVNFQTGQSSWILAPAQGPNQDLISVIFQVVFDISLLFIMNIVVVSVVIICTAVTVIRLKQAMAWRLSTNSSSSSDALNRQITLTKMLVVVCCVYAVCSIPGCIMALVRRIDPGYTPGGRYANMFAVTHVVGYTLFSASNSSVNFFVFYRMSSRFRQELRGLCLGKKANGMTGQSEATKTTE